MENWNLHMEHNTLQITKRKLVTRAATEGGWESVDNVNYSNRILKHLSPHFQGERRTAEKEMELNEFVFIWKQQSVRQLFQRWDQQDGMVEAIIMSVLLWTWPGY